MQRGMGPSNKRSRATKLELAKSHLDRAQAQVGELEVLSQGMSAAPAAKQGLTSKTTVETTAPAPAPARKGQIFVRVNQAAETVAEADGSKKRVGATKTLEASSADLVASVKRQLQGTCAAQRLLFAGRELPDHATLAECGVSLESTLDALPRCVGGGGGQTKLSKTGAGAGARADGGADAAGPAVGAAPTLAARTTVAAVRVDAHNRALTEENAALARENATLKERLAAAATSTASEARPDAKQGLTSKTTVETTAPAPASPGRSLKEDEAQLRRRIEADPQAFFAQADTNKDGSLTRDEWAQACESVLGHAAPDLAKALFDKMDFDKSGVVSMRHFVDIRRAVRLFVMQSGFQELVVESLSGLVYGHLSANASADAGTPLAEQTLDTLTELSAEEMRDELAPLYASLKEHGEQVKLDREARAKNLAKLEVDTAEGKFTQLPTAAYGDKDSFHQGLEVLGLPHPDVLTEMRREFLGAPDSEDAFTAWNSGPNETNCIKEWHFVVDPFEDTPGWQDLSPEEWTPRYKYGGNRIPIRLEVFMHAMSVYPWNKKEKRFGDYKHAHKLDKKDPKWLHEKEVDKVKVVLCRYSLSLARPLARSLARLLAQSLSHYTLHTSRT